MEVINWTQYGVAGLVAMSLGGVIAYIFKLFVHAQRESLERTRDELRECNAEGIRLHGKIEDQQRAVLQTLSDVARVMSEVQQMMREREIQTAMEKEFERRKAQQ
jgi:hypothetical protein